MRLAYFKWKLVLTRLPSRAAQVWLCPRDDERKAPYDQSFITDHKSRPGGRAARREDTHNTSSQINGHRFSLIRTCLSRLHLSSDELGLLNSWEYRPFHFCNRFSHSRQVLGDKLFPMISNFTQQGVKTTALIVQRPVAGFKSWQLYPPGASIPIRHN
jgi:hypothetical protein